MSVPTRMPLLPGRFRCVRQAVLRTWACDIPASDGEACGERAAWLPDGDSDNPEDVLAAGPHGSVPAKSSAGHFEWPRIHQLVALRGLPNLVLIEENRLGKECAAFRLFLPALGDGEPH